MFASSNHAVGFHKQSARLDAAAPLRPDGNYGISKVFGEATAQYYFDRFGIETVSMRRSLGFGNDEPMRIDTVSMPKRSK